MLFVVVLQRHGPKKGNCEGGGAREVGESQGMVSQKPRRGNVSRREVLNVSISNAKKRRWVGLTSEFLKITVTGDLD